MTRTVRDKNQSQIVFDIHGGEKEFVTMNLRTIPNRQPLIKSQNENFNLRTDDIEGAQYRPPKVYNHNFQYDISDIEGTSTHPMVDPHKKATDIMSVDDIEGAKPKVQRALPHSNRMTNPLNPQYDLPSFKEEPIPVPHFIRDNINVDDIPGTHSKSYKTDKPPRDIMRVDDIQGTQPRKRILNLSGCNRDTLNVKDINNDGIFRSTRVTDPLNPVYLYDGQKIEATDFGRALPNRHEVSGRNFKLNTQDIDGAQADSSTKWYRTFKPPPPPREEDEMKPAELLMLPSMKLQTKELEMQEKIRQYRGDKIHRYENRNLHVSVGTGDPIQAMLRQQRENKKLRNQRNDNHTTKITIE
ncbi:hypothetical protein TRFO_19130 [Tritrichomonas foetus]|uniref:Uncharacterized protein n=1 Tax=Tritrichomonas foetus TaxID=1144522 RepID=A0A1J4KJL5_9EUKA|nr:hypothetical protein TRFO_19130 [Tritrichomonas foetus]|eukprot:OHT11403.1 hypothetical protein TRFO_19130 [Tritrichomonas foetus]